LTHKATEKFQKRYRLNPIDGIVGRKTWGKAIMLGFDVSLMKDDKNNYYPPKPSFDPIVGNDKRMELFGHFDYTHSPTKNNPERIIVDKGWKKEHIVFVKLPALEKATSGKFTGMWWHKDVKDQLESFFNELYQNKLHTKIISYAGSYVPRFIRGSRKTLSNHSWGTAFDINAPQNWYLLQISMDSIGVVISHVKMVCISK
jgi:hypothetical protein